MHGEITHKCLRLAIRTSWSINASVSSFHVFRSVDGGSRTPSGLGRYGSVSSSFSSSFSLSAAGFLPTLSTFADEEEGKEVFESLPATFNAELCSCAAAGELACVPVSVDLSRRWGDLPSCWPAVTFGHRNWRRTRWCSCLRLLDVCAASRVQDLSMVITCRSPLSLKSFFMTSCKVELRWAWPHRWISLQQFDDHVPRYLTAAKFLKNYKHDPSQAVPTRFISMEKCICTWQRLLQATHKNESILPFMINKKVHKTPRLSKNFMV